MYAANQQAARSLLLLLISDQAAGRAPTTQQC